MDNSQSAAVRADREIMAELVRRARGGGLARARTFGVPTEAVEAALTPESGARNLDGALGDPGFEASLVTEAIVLEFGRPALLVQNDTFEVPEADVWKGRLYPSKARL